MLRRFLVCFLLAAPAAGTLFPAETPPAAQVRFSLRSALDTNLFLQDEAPLAAGQTRAALPAGAEAVAFTATAAVETSWKGSSVLKVDLAYAPEITRYTRYTSEDHTDHRVTVNAGGTIDDWRYELRGSSLFTHGSTDSPNYNRLGGAPCIGAEPVRARRTQDIHRWNALVLRKFPQGFVRGVAATYLQDFHTAERSLSGYANYADRSETSGGLEAGWNLRKDLALVAGIRGGHQQQANVLGTRLNYTNTFTRYLAGIEGSLGRSLKFALLAGPDERRYGTDVAAGFLRRRDPGYGEGSLTWTPRAPDTLTLTGKRYAWFSSGGRGAYVDLLADFSWKHRFDANWSSVAAFNHHTGDSRGYSVSPRDEAIEGLRFALTRKLGPASLEASWLHEWSTSGIPNTPGRVYHRDVAALGASRAW